MSAGTPSGASGSLVPPLTTTPTIDSPHSCVRPRSGVLSGPSTLPAPPHQPHTSRKCNRDIRLGKGTWTLLVGYLSRGEDLDVGDQLPHRGTCLTGVASQLSFELDATP